MHFDKRFPGILVLTLLLAAILGSIVTAQEVQLDPKLRHQTVDAVSRLLGDNYVYPEVAAKMNEHIAAQSKSGVYETIKLPAEFAIRLTKDLQDISKDKHLRVAFDPERVKVLRRSSEDGPSGADRKRFLERARRSNFGFSRVEILDGNIGYLDLHGFSGMKEARPTAIAAMNFLANSDALIIDLRRNGGGSPSMIQLISSYLFDEKPRHLNSFYWRPGDRYSETRTFEEVQGPRMPDTPLYILTSRRTFSAAEEFTYNLKNMKRATIIGETTGGGAHPGGQMVANDLFLVWVPKGRTINPITKTNWEGTGVAPSIEVPADQALDKALGEIRKP